MFLAALRPPFGMSTTRTPGYAWAISLVASRDPSLTTITSNVGYVRLRSDERQSSSVSAALYAQTTTDTDGHCRRATALKGASLNTRDTAASAGFGWR